MTERDVLLVISSSSMVQRLLLLEPFAGGSHLQLVRFVQLLADAGEVQLTVLTLSGKKFKWRSRGGAFCLAQKLPPFTGTCLFDVILCVSVCSLCELIGLRPDLASAHKILYFHENQLAGYPVQHKLERDLQLGFSQLLSCQSADAILWNSAFNRDMFMGEGIDSLFRQMPADQRPDREVLRSTLLSRSHLLPVPVHDEWLHSPSIISAQQAQRTGPLQIVRWTLTERNVDGLTLSGSCGTTEWSMTSNLSSSLRLSSR
jgi:hypothetical protein